MAAAPEFQQRYSLRIVMPDTRHTEGDTAAPFSTPASAASAMTVLLPVVSGPVLPFGTTDDPIHQDVVLLQDVAERLVRMGSSTVRKSSSNPEFARRKILCKDKAFLTFLGRAGLLNGLDNGGVPTIGSGSCRSMNVVPVVGTNLAELCAILRPKWSADTFNAIANAELIDPTRAVMELQAARDREDDEDGGEGGGGAVHPPEVRQLADLLSRHDRCKRFRLD